MTNDLQFGFKSNVSTIMCTNVVIETVQYYVENKSPVFTLFIDASKAFDRLSHIDLFEMLSRRNVCPLIIRLLFNMYINSYMQVRWQNSVSDRFKIGNGVKQGGVLSPMLFNIYILMICIVT